MILTEKFDLKVLTHSDTAIRRGFEEQSIPSDAVVANLELLFDNVLVHLVRSLSGEINVTCAYRCKRVNDAVGSKDTSQHLQGKAADIEYRENGVEKNQVIIDTVKRLNLAYDQMIDEKNLSWVHISYNHGKNRKQFFKL